MDLIDDDRLYSAQQLARIGREHQVDRLRSGDQDVGRIAQEAIALRARRVAGADGDRWNRERIPAGRGDVGDPGKRRAQIPLYIDSQRFQRRDVDDTAASLLLRPRSEHQPVETPEECGQRLAAAGGGKDQRAVATGDGRPAELLRARRTGERAAEPLAHGGMKQRERRRQLTDHRWTLTPSTATILASLQRQNEGGECGSRCSARMARQTRNTTSPGTSLTTGWRSMPAR